MRRRLHRSGDRRQPKTPTPCGTRNKSRAGTYNIARSARLRRENALRSYRSSLASLSFSSVKWSGAASFAKQSDSNSAARIFRIRSRSSSASAALRARSLTFCMPIEPDSASSMTAASACRTTPPSVACACRGPDRMLTFRARDQGFRRSTTAAKEKPLEAAL
jgi:hypothetical protein